MYTVVCPNARGGDVIDFPVTPVSKSFDSLPEAIEYLVTWFRHGPNGLLRSAQLYSEEGVKLDHWEEMELLGYVPLGKEDIHGHWKLVTCRPRT